MLEIKDLKKSYGSFQLHCSLKVEEGYITGLIGSNGAGKSTTFKSILGLIRKDSGMITLFGKDVDRKRNILVLFYQTAVSARI